MLEELSSRDLRQRLDALGRLAGRFLEARLNGTEERDCPVCAKLAESLGINRDCTQRRRLRKDGRGMTAWRHDTRDAALFHSAAILRERGEDHETRDTS